MENTKNACKHCTKEVASGAKRCPHCQGDLRNWFSRHKILTGILVFVLIIIGLSSIGGGSDSSSSTANSNTENTSAPTEEAIVVTAVQLSREYDDNKVAADAKYEDKIVEVSGVVNDIGKDILDDPYVTLEGISSSLFGIQCMFPRKDESQLATLSKGQSITLQGRVSGELIGNVILRGCSIVN